MSQSDWRFGANPPAHSVPLERDQPDGVALGVFDECLPFVVACGPKCVVFVAEDHVWSAHDLGHAVPPLERGVHVVDAQIDQR